MSGLWVHKELGRDIARTQTDSRCSPYHTASCSATKAAVKKEEVRKMTFRVMAFVFQSNHYP